MEAGSKTDGLSVVEADEEAPMAERQSFRPAVEGPCTERLAIFRVVSLLSKTGPE